MYYLFDTIDGRYHTAVVGTFGSSRHSTVPESMLQIQSPIRLLNSWNLKQVMSSQFPCNTKAQANELE